MQDNTITAAWYWLKKPFTYTGCVVLVLYKSSIDSTNNKHLLVFLAPNIIFVGQLDKDIGDAQANSQIEHTTKKILGLMYPTYKFKHGMANIRLTNYPVQFIFELCDMFQTEIPVTVFNVEVNRGKCLRC